MSELTPDEMNVLEFVRRNCPLPQHIARGMRQTFDDLHRRHYIQAELAGAGAGLFYTLTDKGVAALAAEQEATEERAWYPQWARQQHATNETPLLEALRGYAEAAEERATAAEATARELASMLDAAEAALAQEREAQRAVVAENTALRRVADAARGLGWIMIDHDEKIVQVDMDAYHELAKAFNAPAALDADAPEQDDQPDYRAAACEAWHQVGELLDVIANVEIGKFPGCPDCGASYDAHPVRHHASCRVGIAENARKDWKADFPEATDESEHAAYWAHRQAIEDAWTPEMRASDRRPEDEDEEADHD